MKKYIQPNTEITATIESIIMAGSDTHDTMGSDDYEFANTTDFESDFLQVEKKPLWED